MTKVYMIRHAEAEGNIYRRMCGQYNGKLTKLGVQQLDKLEKRFENIHIDKVYYSDLERTRHTSTAITRNRNIESVPEKGLREIYAGEWEFVDFGELSHRYPEDFRAFTYDPGNCEMKGGETFYQVRARMTEAVLRLAAENDGKTIALFTHAYALRTLISGIKELPSEKVRELRGFGNTSVTLLNVEDGKIEIVHEADTSHLGPEDRRPYRPNWNNERGIDVMELRVVGNAGEYLKTFENEYPEVAGRHDNNFCVGLMDGTPVGFAGIDMEKYSHVEGGFIDAFCVLPQYRRKSFAPQLLGYMSARAREEGKKWLYIETEPDGEAEKYFLKFGFEKKGSAGDKSLLGLYIEMEPIEIGVSND